VQHTKRQQATAANGFHRSSKVKRRTKEQMSIEKQLNIAEQFIRSNQFFNAEISIKNLLEVAPENALVTGIAGRLAFANSDYEGAISLLQRSLEVDPLNIPNRSTFFLCLIKANIVIKKYSELQSRIALLGIGIERGRLIQLLQAFSMQFNGSATLNEIAHRFDDNAAKYHITDENTLGAFDKLYSLVLAWLAAVGKAQIEEALDLGCGTGESGERFRHIAGHLTGVDISPNMVKIASDKNIYDNLTVAGIIDFLKASNPNKYGLIYSNAVFCYFGNLETLFQECRRVLSRTGIIAFDFIDSPYTGYTVLEPQSLQFQHHLQYVLDSANKYGLYEQSHSSCELRFTGELRRGHLLLLGQR
jgi:predicted TPR repeat methyltransferase